MIYVGIDVAKDKHDCCIVDSNGTILKDSLRIPNTRQGFEILYTSILSFLPNKTISNVKIGLESTGHYSTNIQNYLYAKGFHLSVLNPLATNLFRKAQTLRKTKTDKTDALVIAKMLFSDDTKSYSPVSYQIQELKSLTRHHYRLVGYRSKLKVSVTRLLDIIFPELATYVWSIHQPSVYALLSEFPNPKEISNCHLTKLTNLLYKATKGRYGREKADEIRNAASSSIGTSTKSLSLELQQTIRLIKSVQNEIVILDEQIKELMIEIDSPIMSIPGISYNLASIILSEIGDVHRFTNPAKLLAFAGLDPSTYQSGKYNATYTPMVKRGSAYLRWAILMASRTASMQDLTFSNYLAKKQGEGKHYYIAMSHVAKKLIRVIFYLLTTNTTFIPQI